MTSRTSEPNPYLAPERNFGRVFPALAAGKPAAESRRAPSAHTRAATARRERRR
jgi:hypothetical protein